MAALTSAPLVVCALCSWIFCSVLSEDTSMIEAKSGDDVTLHCQDPDKSSISVLKWKRSDLESDEYVFLFRENRPYENYQLPCYRGRVELRDPEMKNGDMSVILRNVTFNDTGTYECRVPGSSRGRRKRAADLRQTINLEVTESGHSAGQTEDGGNKEERNLPAHVGLISLVVVAAVVVCSFIFVLMKRRSPQNLEQPAADGAHEEIL